MAEDDRGLDRWWAAAQRTEYLHQGPHCSAGHYSVWWFWFWVLPDSIKAAAGKDLNGFSILSLWSSWIVELVFIRLHCKILHWFCCHLHVCLIQFTIPFQFSGFFLFGDEDKWLQSNWMEKVFVLSVGFCCWFLWTASASFSWMIKISFHTEAEMHQIRSTGLFFRWEDKASDIPDWDGHWESPDPVPASMNPLQICIHIVPLEATEDSGFCLMTL